jgi:hypothetical protein
MAVCSTVVVPSRSPSSESNSRVAARILSTSSSATVSSKWTVPEATSAAEKPNWSSARSLAKVSVPTSSTA